MHDVLVDAETRRSFGTQFIAVEEKKEKKENPSEARKGSRDRLQKRVPTSGLSIFEL